MGMVENRVAGERIPRVIHYCWFGRGEKSKKIQKCMRSWQNVLPDYIWQEWNEDTFDIQANAYVRQAYDAKKYAFVSDYVRLFALYRYGGIYMDTDVEVLQPLDRFLTHRAFSGFEDDGHVPTGLMSAEPMHPVMGKLMNMYEDKNFERADGSLDLTTNTAVISRYFAERGLLLNGCYQEVDDVAFYPRTYFCPYDYINGANYLTAESYTIHHFAKSWLPAHVRWRSDLKRVTAKMISPEFVAKMRAVFKSP